jgi:hypothetical protein
MRTLEPDMDIDDYIAKLEQHVLRAREMNDKLLTLIEDSNHRIGLLQKLCGELLGMMTEIAPEQIAKRRQALMTLVHSSPQADEAFSRFLLQALGDGR